MLLTQPDIDSDWRGNCLDFLETYLLVDHATLIANYPDEIQDFLECNYPDAINEYQPQSNDDWLECLSSCTTTPEYHRANIFGIINNSTEI